MLTNEETVVSCSSLERRSICSELPGLTIPVDPTPDQLMKSIPLLTVMVVGQVMPNA
jgi:hypothetical protein